MEPIALLSAQTFYQITKEAQLSLITKILNWNPVKFHIKIVNFQIRDLISNEIKKLPEYIVMC
jgi:hypothetical protein